MGGRSLSDFAAAADSERIVRAGQPATMRPMTRCRTWPLRATLPLAIAAMGACSFPTVVERIGAESPRAELGRPGWVRAPASAGAWVGGAVGAVAAIPFAIVGWPLGWLAEDGLGKTREEFTYAPVSVGAATGQFLFGAPFDGIDWVFRRAWTEAPPALPESGSPAGAAARGAGS